MEDWKRVLTTSSGHVTITATVPEILHKHTHTHTHINHAVHTYDDRKVKTPQISTIHLPNTNKQAPSRVDRS